MYINRALLLAIGVLIVFMPSLADWLTDSATAWHRPYQLWLLVVLAAYWNQRSGSPDEL
ncbi:MAG: hypothetical protein U5K56_15170 [Halioglobus sp.]|nr:hypothetical protein [Halioglobus sp.]